MPSNLPRFDEVTAEEENSKRSRSRGALAEPSESEVLYLVSEAGRVPPRPLEDVPRHLALLPLPVPMPTPKPKLKSNPTSAPAPAQPLSRSEDSPRGAAKQPVPQGSDVLAVLMAASRTESYGNGIAVQSAVSSKPDALVPLESGNTTPPSRVASSSSSSSSSIAGREAPSALDLLAVAPLELSPQREQVVADADLDPEPKRADALDGVPSLQPAPGVRPGPVRALLARASAIQSHAGRDHEGGDTGGEPGLEVSTRSYGGLADAFLSREQPVDHVKGGAGTGGPEDAAGALNAGAGALNAGAGALNAGAGGRRGSTGTTGSAASVTPSVSPLLNMSRSSANKVAERTSPTHSEFDNDDDDDDDAHDGPGADPSRGGTASATARSLIAALQELGPGDDGA